MATAQYQNVVSFGALQRIQQLLEISKQVVVVLVLFLL
jgi:hypothetical protein